MEWLSLKGIVENGDNYSVSSTGLVRNDKKDTLLRPTKNAKGYLEISCSLGGKPKKYRVNRLVALAFTPNPEGKEQVNHKDGNKENNYVGNLEWATCTENVRHAYAIGLASNRGERAANRKLSKLDVVEIKKLIGKMTNVRIAKMYGMQPSTISAIKCGKIWSDVIVEED